MKNSKWRTLVVSAVIFASSVIPSVAQGERDTCHRYRLGTSVRPGWSVSGDWLAPNQLVLVDNLNRRLLSFDEKARFLGTEQKHLPVRLQAEFEADFAPSAISSDGKRTWLQMPIAKFARLGPGQSVEQTANLWRAELSYRGETVQLIAIMAWTLVDDDEIFGFGKFEMADQTISTGFFRISLDEASDGILYEAYHEGHPMQLWYRVFGSSLVTAEDDRAYGLVVGDHSYIVESRPKASELHPLDARPVAVRETPEILDFVTPDDFVELMADLETKRSPVGLYAWQDDLYLLWRQQPEDASQQWFLSKIDLRRDELVGTMVLPTRASHLMVVPGPRQWALVEKGPVKGFGNQSISTVTFIPAREVRDFDPGTTICN